MTLFVTGGSGFVGRALLAELAKRGRPARALARSEGAAEIVRGLGAEPARASLDDGAAIARALEGCDAIVHSAAKVDEWGPRDEFYRTNVEATKRLLELGRAAGVRRFVHISTEAVLADGAPIVDADETRPYPARFAGLYPETKAEAERAVLAASGGGFEALALRPRFVWGLGDTTLVPKLAEAMRRGRFAWVDGGHFLTSTCHVGNLVEAVCLALERGAGGQAYFVTDGPPVEFRAFVTSLLRTQGVEPPARSVPRALARAAAALAEGAAALTGRRPPFTRTGVALAGQRVTVVDRKARRELGYEGTITRDEGLAQMAAASAPAGA
ncbi:MAG TPA: NAD-dependent epimerase/dehydratase family protein [Polyangiaceae bacterium]|nr:NAD-dependent epimerase/dehydratase family protein [Polyangiaceae bacterium]